jgi:hypothetical protein
MGMPTVHSQAAGLASSDTGRWLAWSEPGRLRVRDLSRPSQITELAVALDPPFELAVSTTDPEQLLVLQPRASSTVIRVFTLPQLREVVEARLSLKREAHLVSLYGSVALFLAGTESLTAVDLAKLRATPLPVRGPIQVVVQVAPDQVLVGARGKLEAWSLAERRPTHRLGLSLPRDAGFGGVVSNGRLLWVASTGAPGTVALFRLSDGKQLATATAGGVIKAVAASTSSTTLVAQVQPEGGKPLQLVALDLEAELTRALAFDRPIAAFCLTGAPSDAVAILPEHGEPVVLPLATGAVGPPLRASEPAGDAAALAAGESPAGAEPGEPAPPDREPPGAADPGAPLSLELGTDPDGAGPERTPELTPELTNDLAARLNQWRAQVQAVVVAAPPRLAAPGERVARAVSEEPRSRSRAELHAWGQSARARTTTTPPPPPQVWRLTDLASRFKLEVRSRSLLALLYASWLDGDGRTGVPVAALARALGNDEDAWIEALAQGRLGRMGWVASSRGRTRLRGVVGRFLDEASPRIALVPPSEQALASLGSPAQPARWTVPDRAALARQAGELANRLAAPVAVVELAALPVARLEAVLGARLLEARLHGALAIVVPSEAAALEPRLLLDGPVLVAWIAGAPEPPAWQALPVWPDARPDVDLTAPTAVPDPDLPAATSPVFGASLPSGGHDQDEPPRP